ncbi:MAG TPA: hypothetical protein VLI55_13205 [Bryobacteraceae bacterium]|nr:hypothetical protein [Bryobacteraceae bacterium]
MSSSTAKRVVLYRFDRQPLEGIVNPAAFLLKNGVELITLDGTLQNIPYNEFKALCFVSEALQPDLFSDHNLFERRPKVPGLWTRFVFRDGDRLDGILSHNLLDWPESGFFITPPRAGVNRQRVFIPRAALTGTELRGVVGTSMGASASRKRKSAGPENQLSMFEP